MLVDVDRCLFGGDKWRDQVVEKLDDATSGSAEKDALRRHRCLNRITSGYSRSTDVFGTEAIDARLADEVLETMVEWWVP
jgi:hypothetical protein